VFFYYRCSIGKVSTVSGLLQVIPQQSPCKASYGCAYWRETIPVYRVPATIHTED